eukprot:gene11592-7987_t
MRNICNGVLVSRTPCLLGLPVARCKRITPPSFPRSPPHRTTKYDPKKNNAHDSKKGGLIETQLGWLISISYDTLYGTCITYRNTSQNNTKCSCASSMDHPHSRQNTQNKKAWNKKKRNGKRRKYTYR